MGASLIFDLFGRDVSASKALRKVAAEAETSSGKLGAAFKKAATGVTVAGLAGLAESTRMAGDFQAQMTRLVTAAGESEGNLHKVSSGVLQISRDTGTSTKELAAGMYMVESAGFHGAAGLKVMSAAAQGAKIEGADLGATGNALTTVMNDLHAPASQAANVMSQMVATVGQGKMTMDDLAGSIHSVLPNAAALKISFPEVAGALAEMTSQGISADQAAQNLNHVIVKLASPTAAMTAAMASYNVNAADVAKNLGKNGLTGTFGILSEAIFKKMGPAGVTLRSAFNESKAAAADATREYSKLSPEVKKLADLFMTGKISAHQYTFAVGKIPGMAGVLGKSWMTAAKNANGFSAALKSGGQDGQTFTAAMKSMTGDQTGLQVALHLTGKASGEFGDKVKTIGKAGADASGNVQDWSIKQKTLNVQMERLAATVKTAMIEIGTRLIPIVTASVMWVNKHKVALAYLVGGLVALAVTIKVVTALHKAWTMAMKAAHAIAVAYRGVMALVNVVMNGSALATVRSTAALVAQKIAMVAGVIATQAAAAAMWLFNAAISANPITLIVIAIAALVGAFVLAYNKIGWFRNLVKSAFTLISHVISGTFHWVKDHWPLLLAILTGPIGLLILWITRNWGKITAAFSAALTWVRQHWPLLLAILTGPVGLAILWITRNWDRITGAIAAVGRGIARVWGRLWSGLTSVVRGVVHGIGGLVNGMWNGVTDGLKSGLNGAIALLNGAIGFINSALIDTANEIPFVNIPHIPNIPSLAQGATILPREGGTLVRVAEAGRAETVVDTGLMNSALAKLSSRTQSAGRGGHTSRPATQAGATIVNVNVTGQVVGTTAELGRVVVGALETVAARGVRMNIGRAITT